MQGPSQLIALLLHIVYCSSFHSPIFQQSFRSASKLLGESPDAHQLMADPRQPWYSHSTIGRDRANVMASCQDIARNETSQYVLVGGKGSAMYHKLLDVSDPRSSAEPLYLTFDQISKILNPSTVDKSLLGKSDDLIAWIGNLNGSNFFVCYIAEHDVTDANKIVDAVGQDNIAAASLRDFGDRLKEPTDAGILSTANGLVEFHKSHPFCSKCGSKTVAAKVGACRRCTSCKTSIYPRIDVAAIMLITSPCENYALLGRKASWPQGRYSTLAGFCEVGETIEQACAREVFEESGVVVDSIHFLCSQPWPFPRSLMAGFRGKACKTPGKDLPTIIVDETELQDVRWFHREYVKERLYEGSTALDFLPNEQEKEFHLPGSSSLGRLLITQWATES